MKIEAGQVIYRENLAGIWLTPVGAADARQYHRRGAKR
jgi:hypothetical protein